MQNLYTDGSCAASWHGKRGLGGWAWIRIRNHQIAEAKQGTERNTTARRMELIAVLNALRSLPEDAAATIWTDYMECITAIECHDLWQAHGWRRTERTTAGEEPMVVSVENVSLITEMKKLLDARPLVKIQHVGRDHAWIQEADRLANQARRDLQERLTKESESRLKEHA